MRRHRKSRSSAGSVPATGKLVALDRRFSCEVQNAEALPYPSGSFVLVFCREGLHHLARPWLGVYEMLRVCRKAAIVIEPYDTLAGRVLERLGRSSVYEVNQHRNLRFRDNYVFRFSRGGLESMLNCYCVRSGYRLELTLGWLSGKVNLHPNRMLRSAGAFTGWLLGFTPGSPGNYCDRIDSTWKGPATGPAPGERGDRTRWFRVIRQTVSIHGDKDHAGAGLGNPACNVLGRVPARGEVSEARSKSSVSVIIPAYLAEHSLPATLDSVWAQTLPAHEVIVINDGSPDRTADVVRRYGDRIIYIEQENAGQGAARNRGLERATGEFVAFLDADDYWRPEFLSRCVAFLRAHPETVAVSTGCILKLRDGRERVLPPCLNGKSNQHARVLEKFFRFWAEQDHVRTGSNVIRRSVINQAGFQRADLRMSQDSEYWGYIATHGQWGFIPEPLWVGN
ncbi:MAG: glycosyltransferase [Verrucomicrobia bacterium]|nr:glycosyltransferase [Verrucomicrobiota bacterium]